MKAAGLATVALATCLVPHVGDAEAAGAQAGAEDRFVYTRGLVIRDREGKDRAWLGLSNDDRAVGLQLMDENANGGRLVVLGVKSGADGYATMEWGTNDAMKSVADLERRIRNLEATVATLTRAGRGRATSPAASPNRGTRAAWRRLHLGLTTEQVKSIFGEPGKVMDFGINSLGGHTIFWYYPNALGRRVDLENGRVRAWNEP